MCEWSCESPVWKGGGYCVPVELDDTEWRCICDAGYATVNEFGTPSCIPEQAATYIYVAVLTVSVLTFLQTLFLRRNRIKKIRKMSEVNSKSAGRARQDKLRNELSHWLFIFSLSMIIVSVMLLSGFNYKQVIPALSIPLTATVVSLLTTLRLICGVVPKNLLQPGTAPRRVCDWIDASSHLNVAYYCLAGLASGACIAAFWYPYIGMFFIHVACLAGVIVLEGAVTTVAFSFYILTRRKKNEEGLGDCRSKRSSSKAISPNTTTKDQRRKSVQPSLEADYNRGMRKLILLLVGSEVIGALCIIVSAVGAFTYFGRHHSLLFIALAHGVAPSLWMGMVSQALTPAAKSNVIHVINQDSTTYHRRSSLATVRAKAAEIERDSRGSSDICSEPRIGSQRYRVSTLGPAAEQLDELQIEEI